MVFWTGTNDKVSNLKSSKFQEAISFDTGKTVIWHAMCIHCLCIFWEIKVQHKAQGINNFA